MKSIESKCIFCLNTKGPFSRVEHPIPESLGNDDLFLNPGFVCDPCNQYFGSKVEQKVLNAAPFGVERVAAVVKTKRGKLPKFQRSSDLSLFPAGCKDHLIFAAAPNEYLGVNAKYFSYDASGRLILNIAANQDDDFYTVRLLLKMGLELLLLTDGDPYDPIFNAARIYTRYAPTGTFWEMGYALYPRREDLNISEKLDKYGLLTTHQLYQYSIGKLFSGDVGFCFIYRQHIFACNLSSPTLAEYINGFNRVNEMKMTRIFVKR